jgi:hypothetical protein
VLEGDDSLVARGGAVGVQGSREGGDRGGQLGLCGRSVQVEVLGVIGIASPIFFLIF